MQGGYSYFDISVYTPIFILSQMFVHQIFALTLDQEYNFGLTFDLVDTS